MKKKPRSLPFPYDLKPSHDINTRFRPGSHWLKVYEIIRDTKGGKQRQADEICKYIDSFLNENLQ